ncbi:hypothetical protein VPH35_033821 [Triticum aestivum]|uniref:Uncharacterized protein n=1 Tax=Aegilops tauschii TaxID=37682 RepID=M8CDG1_AEGTA
MGEGVIVGILDNDINPCHVSFLDDDMPPPAKWHMGATSPMGAFQDSVEVISMSLGDDMETRKPFYKDLIVVGSFPTVMSDLFVGTNTVNASSLERTLTKCALWLLTVAASTMGRRLISRVELGNGMVLDVENLKWYKRVRDNPFPLHLHRGNVCRRRAQHRRRPQQDRGVPAQGGPHHALGDDPEGGRRGHGQLVAASRMTHADGEMIMAYINSTPNVLAFGLMRQRIEFTVKLKRGASRQWHRGGQPPVGLRQALRAQPNRRALRTIAQQLIRTIFPARALFWFIWSSSCFR